MPNATHVRCRANTAKGTPCTKAALPGSRVCLWHDDSQASRARRRAMAQKGGETKAYGALPSAPSLASGDPAIAGFDLRTAQGVRDLLAATLRALSLLPFDVRVSNSVAQLAQAQRAAIDVADIESRLEALEQQRPRRFA